MPTDGHWDCIRDAEYARAHPCHADASSNVQYTPMDRSDTDSPPPLVEESSEELPPTPPPMEEVDIILAVKLRRSVTHRHLDTMYLVKWVGHSPEYATWEPAANLWGAWEAVIEAHAFFGLDPPEFPNPLP